MWGMGRESGACGATGHAAPRLRSPPAPELARLEPTLARVLRLHGERRCACGCCTRRERAARAPLLLLRCVRGALHLQLFGRRAYRLLHVIEYADDGRMKAEQVWIDLAAIQQQLTP